MKPDDHWQWPMFRVLITLACLAFWALMLYLLYTAVTGGW